MAKIRIDFEESGKPAATITVPLWLARGASGVLSSVSGGDLGDLIDIDHIIREADNPAANGVILEIEDHEDGEKITISILRDEHPLAQA